MSKPEYLQNMLDLSTAYMPGENPDFGELRSVQHEHGWIVFVGANTDDFPIGQGEPTVPEWLDEIYKEACKHSCILINFDADGRDGFKFKTYDW